MQTNTIKNHTKMREKARTIKEVTYSNQELAKELGITEVTMRNKLIESGVLDAYGNPKRRGIDEGLYKINGLVIDDLGASIIFSKDKLNWKIEGGPTEDVEKPTLLITYKTETMQLDFEEVQELKQYLIDNF